MRINSPAIAVAAFVAASPTRPSSSGIPSQSSPISALSPSSAAAHQNFPSPVFHPKTPREDSHHLQGSHPSGNAGADQHIIVPNSAGAERLQAPPQDKVNVRCFLKTCTKESLRSRGLLSRSNGRQKFLTLEELPPQYQKLAAHLQKEQHTPDDPQVRDLLQHGTVESQLFLLRKRDSSSHGDECGLLQGKHHALLLLTFSSRSSLIPPVLGDFMHCSGWCIWAPTRESRACMQ